MTRYAYVCPDCGEVEADKPKGAIPCPRCGKLALRKWAVTPLPSTCHPTKGAK